MKEQAHNNQWQIFNLLTRVEGVEMQMNLFQGQIVESGPGLVVDLTVEEENHAATPGILGSPLNLGGVVWSPA